MKSQKLFVGLVLSFFVITGRAAELFVSPGGGHVAPFSDWLTAATNIQLAIDVATSGDIVTVTNGIYATGGKVKDGNLTNRIAVDKPILVQSVNGPGVTVIQGAWDPATNGPLAVRCAWLTNGATLSGFTLRGGATHTGISQIATTNCGGGVWSASRGSVVTNCIITGNAAYAGGGGVFSNTVVNSVIASNVVTLLASVAGGGAYESVLKNSAILGNRIPFTGSGLGGGGVYRGALTNCTVIGNYASTGGGVFGSPQTPVMNCIVWGNTSPSATEFTNISGPGPVLYSCVGPLRAGTGNIAADPQLLSDGIHLAITSPCRGAGNAAFVTGVDIDARMWSNPPAMGCDEWMAEPLVLAAPQLLPGRDGQLLISFGLVAGQEPIEYRWLKDGLPLVGTNYGGLTTTRLSVNKLGPSDAGGFQLVASNAFGMATSAVAQVMVRCVNVAALSPVAPYSDWPSAATNIQTAIEASAVGDIVLVTNGVYGFGGKVMAGDLTNRIAIDKAMIVMSVNGATYTTIEGTPGPGGIDAIITPSNTNAVRCAWLGDGAVLSGFTLRGGGTRATSAAQLGIGGGAFCTAQSALLSYCNIRENSAYFWGGGVYGGTLNNCTVSANGVGMVSIFQYASGRPGGGTYNSELNNCLLRGNRSGGEGGGAYGGVLNNCTVIDNQAEAGNSGGGTRNSAVRNSIVWNNSSSFQPNVSGGTVVFSCSGNAVAGTGNITNNPLFLADGIHLSSTSPCRDAGSPAYATGADLDEQAWTNPPSMGCDQWLPVPLILDFKMQASHWNQFDFKTLIAGIESSPGYWLKDGMVLSESARYVGAQTTALAVKGISVSDNGNYQLIVSNSFGMTTSRVAEVRVHFANAGNPGATFPYTNWTTAAATIQDAIDAASPDAVILVTNGLYNSGGKPFVPWFTVTNRITLDKPLVVASLNGPFQTVIEGQWDPTSTNGALAVRCALLSTNSSLAGFTLRNGATEAGGIGGGIYAFNDALVSSCIISNNQARRGGGAAFGAFNNCWVTGNSASELIAGLYGARSINNCTVVANVAAGFGGGVLATVITNSIIWFNSLPNVSGGSLYNSCTFGTSVSSGNITNDPQLVDGLHLAATSPCRGAGANILSNSTDLDGDLWLVPPSMGCDEFNAAATVGPLFVTIHSPTSALANRSVSLIGGIIGRATRIEWNFGDGVVLTNGSYITSHAWTNAGDYLVTFTAFNTDYPSGVSGSVTIHVDPIFAPTLSMPGLANGTNFQFQFSAQAGASYWAEYATNLAPPVTWFTVKSLTSTGGVEQIVDTKATNSARFYRVRAQ